MNVEIYLEMTPKVDIHITIYPIPIHPSPIPELGLGMSKTFENGTEKQQKNWGSRMCLCYGSKERLICRG